MLDRPADDASAPHGSAFDDALAPERIEERDERKPENGEIVAVDLLEQLHAERFKLIGPDRAQDFVSGGGEVKCALSVGLSAPSVKVKRGGETCSKTSIKSSSKANVSWISSMCSRLSR